MVQVLFVQTPSTEYGHAMQRNKAMTTSSTPSSSGDQEPRDTIYWAQQISTIRVTRVPTGALDLNVEGHRLVGPLQGFGQLWQKIYWVVLKGSTITPTELIKVWKENFPKFWPKASHFYPSLHGIAPGEIALLSSPIPGGLPVLVSTGVFVLYADDVSFTFMTPQGHPASAWITFSAYEEEGDTIAQIHVLMRANDPIYEAGFRVLGSRGEDELWQHTLTALAAHFDVKTPVLMQQSCLDPKVQWSEAKNVWENAAIRTMLYWMVNPVIWIGHRLRR
jgi:hypothetical protein